MSAIIYSRVSTEVQATDRQVDDIKRYCDLHNINIIKEFTEKETGRKDKRPVLSEMLNFLIKNVNIEYLIIHELSRLGRTNEVLNTIHFLNERNICLISLKENIRTLNPDKSVNPSSALLTSILSGINSFELETIKYRVSSGLRKSIVSGNSGGSNNLPYGYKKMDDKKLIPDEVESEVINKIFELYISGIGTKRISNYLNDKNIPTRRKILIDKGLYKGEVLGEGKLLWTDGPVYEILTNPIYKGLRRYKGELLEQPQLKIIEPENFDRVQQMLKDNCIKEGINRKYNFLLKNKKIVCGVCGQSYFAYRKRDTKSTNERYKDNRFICLSRRYGNGCENFGISINKIELFIQTIIVNDFTEVLMKKIDNKDILNQISQREAEIEQLNKQFDKITKSESVLVDLLVNNEINRETFNAKNKNNRTQYQTIKRDITLKSSELVYLKKTYANINDIKKIEAKFKKGVTLDKTIVNKIIKEIVIKPSNIFGKNYNPELITNDIYQEEEQNFNFFPKPYDKVVELTICVGNTTQRYFLSQRENFYLTNDFIKINLPYPE